MDTARTPPTRSITPHSFDLPSSRPVLAAGVALPSGVETARRHEDRVSGGRAPAAPGPAMRIDAPGAPAREFGTPSTTPSPRPDRDQSGHVGAGQDHGDHGHDDHHDQSAHHRPDRGGHGGTTWTTWNCSLFTRPANYVYDFGSGLGYTYNYPPGLFGYTDISPPGTFGYQSSFSYPPLYAWQYETDPIYNWDAQQSYTPTLAPDVWSWQTALTGQSFVTGGTWTAEQPTFLVDPGVAVVQSSVAAPTINAEPSLEQRRAESRLLSRINRTYDVSPDFRSALDGAIQGDYSASIYAMRLAAGVNPAAMVGSNSRLARAMRDDRDLAQRAAYTRQVFQNAPQRVVSEADAQFMVGALSAAMGETESAEQHLSAAQAAGDGAISTELLRRAVRGENLDPAGPWVPGQPLVR